MYRKILENEYQRRVVINPRYSKRAFAKHLDISSSALTELISGKRGLSLKKAESIVQKLQLPKEEEEHFINSVKGTKSYFKNRQDGISNDKHFKNLSEDKFSYIADWYHFAILNIARIAEQNYCPENIAQRLGIDLNIAIEALERLERLGLIAKNENGHIYRTTNSLKTTDDVPSIALKMHHSQMMDKAKNSLMNTPLEERDISGMTIPIDVKNLEKARKKIKKFRRELADFLCKGTPSRVYNLNIQLFPLENKNEN